jgi:hypothetical protein
LFEIRDNNYELDSLNYNLGIISEEKIKDYINGKWYSPIFVNAFFKKITYQTFKSQYLDIDFKNEKINPLLMEYYSVIERIGISIESYNKSLVEVKKIEVVVKLHRDILLSNIINIKNKELDRDLLKKLEIEADFNLKENGLTIEFKPVDTAVYTRALEKIKKKRKE